MTNWLKGLGLLAAGIALTVGAYVGWQWWHRPVPPPAPFLQLSINQGAVLQPNHLIEIDGTCSAPITFDFTSVPGEADFISGIGNTFMFIPRATGDYGIMGVAVDNGTPVVTKKTVRIVVPIPPAPPVPPVPPVPPTPPQPPAPFPATGLHVLMVFDDKTPMPADQTEVFKNVPFLATLDSMTPVESGTHAWRMWPASVADVSAEDKVWQDAWAVPRQSLPWIVISNGKNGTSEPLPANLAAVTALIQKYAK